MVGGATNAAPLQADEYQDSGAVSAPASAIAAAAKNLEKIPILKPYATATKMVASGIGSLARHMGFSSVPVIRDVAPFKNLPFHTLTSAEIGEPLTKLTLDPKNELSIDPTVMGLSPDDDLMISNFIQRESFLIDTTWTSADAIDQVVAGAFVTPMTSTSTNSAPYTSQIVDGTPTSHVAQAFTNWRGSMVYKFIILCSKFHRGRLRFTYDPAGSPSTAAASSNVSFTRIVDIAEETTFEMEIPYMQPLPWSRVVGYQFSPNYVGGRGYSAYGASDQTNGAWWLSVLTQQTSPVSSADIRILVFAKGGKDLEFAYPNLIPSSISPYPYQSGEVEYGEADKGEASVGTMKNDDERFLINMGEKVTSLRTLMNRATLAATDYFDLTNANVTTQMMQWQRPVFPYYPGFDANAPFNARNSAGNADFAFQLGQ